MLLIPVALGIIETPTMAPTEDTKYEYRAWSNLPTNIQGPQNLKLCIIHYRVQFIDGDNKVRNTQGSKGVAAIDPSENGLIPHQNLTFSLTVYRPKISS